MRRTFLANCIFVILVSVLVILACFVSAVRSQCPPPDQPAVSVSAGPSYQQITISVSNLGSNAAGIYISNDGGAHYGLYTTVDSSSGSLIVSGRPSHWTIYVYAVVENSCGTATSSVASATTFDIGTPWIQAWAGPGPSKISVQSAAVPPGAYSMIWLSSNGTSWTLYTS